MKQLGWRLLDLVETMALAYSPYGFKDFFFFAKTFGSSSSFVEQGRSSAMCLGLQGFPEGKRDNQERIKLLCKEEVVEFSSKRSRERLCGSWVFCCKEVGMACA